MKKQLASASRNPKRFPAYRNAKLPSARRVKDLLSRMSLEEKAAQMVCIWREKAKTLVDEDGGFDYAKAKAAFARGHGLVQAGPAMRVAARTREKWPSSRMPFRSFLWKKAVWEFR